MALIKDVLGKSPVIGKGTYLAETATVIGNIQMGENDRDRKSVV